MATTAMVREKRSVKLDIRISPSAKEKLQAAAKALDRRLSDFVTETALSRAEQTLSERTLFGMDAKRWTEFHAALDAPPRVLPRMKKLLTEPGYFDAGSNE